MLAVLVLPIVGTLFIVAELTSNTQACETRTTTPAPNNRPPALWNPNAAAGWSLLFTPAFGAFLHSRNAGAIGRHSEAKANKLWFYVIIAYFGFTLIPIPFVPELFFRATRLVFCWGGILTSVKTR
jgi:hypothetical protein